MSLKSSVLGTLVNHFATSSLPTAYSFSGTRLVRETAPFPKHGSVPKGHSMACWLRYEPMVVVSRFAARAIFPSHARVAVWAACELMRALALACIELLFE